MSNESTLVLIKPDGVNRALIGKVIEKLESTGLKITGMKLTLFGRLINLCSLPIEKLFGPTILSKKLNESLRGKNSPKGTSIFLSK